MLGLDEINKQKAKDYRTIQKRIDSNPKYRESFIKAYEATVMRVHKTGYASNYDDFLCSHGFFLTLTPDQRKNIFERYGKSMSIIEFCTALSGTEK